MNAVVAVLLHLAEDERSRLAGIEDELGSDAFALPTKREAAEVQRVLMEQPRPFGVDVAEAAYASQ